MLKRKLLAGSSMLRKADGDSFVLPIFGMGSDLIRCTVPGNAEGSDKAILTVLVSLIQRISPDEVACFVRESMPLKRIGVVEKIQKWATAFDKEMSKISNQSPSDLADTVTNSGNHKSDPNGCESKPSGHNILHIGEEALALIFSRTSSVLMGRMVCKKLCDTLTTNAPLVVKSDLMIVKHKIRLCRIPSRILLDSMRIPELHELCRIYAVSKSGNKRDIIARLDEAGEQARHQAIERADDFSCPTPNHLLTPDLQWLQTLQERFAASRTRLKLEVFSGSCEPLREDVEDIAVALRRIPALAWLDLSGVSGSADAGAAMLAAASTGATSLTRLDAPVGGSGALHGLAVVLRAAPLLTQLSLVGSEDGGPAFGPRVESPVDAEAVAAALSAGSRLRELRLLFRSADALDAVAAAAASLTGLTALKVELCGRWTRAEGGLGIDPITHGIERRVGRIAAAIAALPQLRSVVCDSPPRAASPGRGRALLRAPIRTFALADGSSCSGRGPVRAFRGRRGARGGSRISLQRLRSGGPRSDLAARARRARLGGGLGVVLQKSGSGPSVPCVAAQSTPGPVTAPRDGAALRI